jgi:nucleoside-diphosphate-sugar epimerase
MRVLVLGGTGLTGPFLVRRLDAMGHEVTVFHRGEHREPLPSGVRRILGDLADPPGELRRMAPHVVLHMWALTQADAIRFLELFHGVAGRAIVISSCDVYRAFGCLQRLESGPPDSGLLSEDAPLRESRYPYRQKKVLEIDTAAYDKILVEQELMAQRELPITILRYPAVWGPHDPQRRFRGWLRRMQTETEIRIPEDFAAWRWTHGYVRDVAVAPTLAVLMENSAGRIYNVGESATPTMAERLGEVGRAAGWRGRLLPVPAAELPEAERMPHDFAHHVAIDTSRIRGELGYAEIEPPEQALAATIDWERAQAAAAQS